MNPDLIQTVAVYALPVVLAITLHEAAHGYVAKYFGDNTAYNQGRVSLNPIVHIDLVGTVIMPALLYLATSGAFLFGYAKPVPVNFGRLRNPRRHAIWVALAGPGSNFVMALGWQALAIGLFAAGQEPESFLGQMARAGVLSNLVMAAFNLFPIPPLDGGRVLVSLLPYKPAVFLSRLEPFGFFIVMALVVVGVVGNLWLRPVMTLLLTAIQLMLAPLMFLVR